MKMKRNLMKMVVGCGALLSVYGSVLAATQEAGTIAKINAVTNEITYSMDKGDTWSKKAPADLKAENKIGNKSVKVTKVLSNGEVVVEEVTAANQQGTGEVVKVENETNAMLYSMDNGKTWLTNKSANLKEGNKVEREAVKVTKVLENGEVVVEKVASSDQGSNGTVVKVNAKTGEQVKVK